MVKKIKKNFSLIEVVIAIAVLSIILGGILFIFEKGLIFSRNLKEEVNLRSLAGETLEYYSRWQELINLTGGNPPRNGSYVLPSITLEGNLYQRTLVISNGPAFGTQLKRIEITIQGRNKNYQAVTLISLIN